MTICEKYLAELVLSGLQGIKPENIPEGITVEEIIEIANKHHILYLLLSALVKTDLAEEDKAKIRPYIHSSMLMTLKQVQEYNLLHAAFEENGVKNQPLKGVYLKDIYPQPMMREMSDIDVLITADSKQASEMVLENLGYVLHEKERHHDVYVKKPHMIVEAHTALYDKTVDKTQYEYFKDFSKAILNDNCTCTYNYNKEDFYVYMMAHMAKHFYAKGCGFRNIVDIYVYRDYYKDKLDEKYIDSELDKCGILQFTKHMERLTNIWLGGEETNEFYDSLFTYMLDSGIYGKVGNGIWSGFAKDKNESTAQYNRKLRRFYWFPPFEYMEKYYPWMKDKKYLLPLGWGVRGVSGLIKHKGTQRREMISHLDEKDIKTYQRIYKEMQFDFHN